jgi:hypothetical protein
MRSTDKLLNYGSFSIEVPKEWKAEEVQPEDSFFGNINTGHNRFVTFDLGSYSNTLDELESGDYQIHNDRLFLLDKATSKLDNLVYKEYGPATEQNINEVRKSIVSWITIDGRKAKLVHQKRPGAGVTGIYIDSLWNDNGTRIRFQISGQPLTRQEDNELVYAIKTLKFYHKPSMVKPE